MLFYRTSPDYRLAARGGVAARGGFMPGAPSNASSAATLRATWMIKSFVTGIALLGLAYWLVQIAGAQYLATLTSATLLSFLLVYIVWCLTVRRRQHPQSPDSVATAESVSGPTVAVRPPAPLNPALKHYGVPPRDCSPPPSYEEVLRQMGMAASSGGLPVLYEDTGPTSSTTTPPEPANEDPSDAPDASVDSPSLDTPSRTPSAETLSLCAPRLGMLSVGLSPERTSPVEPTPPPPPDAGRRDAPGEQDTEMAEGASTSNDHSDRIVLPPASESPGRPARDAALQEAVSLESITIEILPPPDAEVPRSQPSVVTSHQIKYTDHYV